MTAPRKAAQPRDRLPKKTAQQREAENDNLHVIEWRGHQITIDTNPAHLSGKTLLAFEQDRMMTALSGLLGASWALVEDYRIEELNELFELVNDALGFESTGELAPSSA